MRGKSNGSKKDFYYEDIKTFNRKELLSLWNSIKHRTEKSDGKEMEFLFLRAFELEKAEVVWPYLVYDTVGSSKQILEQIDGVIYSDGMSFLVESKDRRDKSDFTLISEFRDKVCKRPGGTMGIFFSKNGVTPPAITKLENQMQFVLLWEGAELDSPLKEGCMREGLIEKYRFSVEQGHPYFNLLLKGA